MNRAILMKRASLLLLPVIAFLCIIPAASGSSTKEFLTPKEIELIQTNQEIQIRVKHYLSFAATRLKAAEERLSGKDSDEGDPLEFFTPEEMVDGYYRIINSVMMNLDDAYRKADSLGQKKVFSGLKALRSSTESSAKELEVLKKIAEEQKKEELWNLVNKAIDITNGAHEGAVEGLKKAPPEPDKKKKDK
jgi:hypothetical protein